jgi:hypothetical protein
MRRLILPSGRIEARNVTIEQKGVKYDWLSVSKIIGIY